MSLSSDRLTSATIIALGLCLVVLVGVGTFSYSFVTAFQGDVTLTSYSASNYVSNVGTPLTEMQGRSRAFIDPDGPVEKSWGIVTKGGVTGIQVDLGRLGPVNFKNGRYQPAYEVADWEPSEEWVVTLSGVEYQICIFRAMFGLTITTATSSSDYGTDEYKSINNFRVNVRFSLDKWEGAADTEIGIGYVYIPPNAEVEGTAFAPSVRTVLIDYQDREYLFGLISAISFNQQPYIAPLAPGTMLWGEIVSVGSSPVGAPNAVDLAFEWSSIAPGVQDVGVIAEQRAEVSEDIIAVVLIMAKTPLFIPGGVPDTDPATARPQPEPTCGFSEDAVRDSQGRILYCQKNNWMQALTMIVVLGAVTLIAIVLIRFLISWSGLSGGRR